MSEPDLVQERMMNEFGFLEALHSFSQFHEFAKSSEKAQISLKGLRPISRSSLNTWQQHLPRIRFQLDRYPELKQIVRKYGYETSDDWLTLLEGVLAKAQTYGEKTPSWLQRKETDIRVMLKSRAYLKRC